MSFIDPTMMADLFEIIIFGLFIGIIAGAVNKLKF